MSSTAITLFLGAILGGGFVLVAASMRTRPIPLADVLDSLEGTSGYAASGRTAPATLTLRQQLGEFASQVAGQGESQLRDLAVVGRSPQEHALVKVVAPAAIVVGAYLVWALLLATGIAIPPIWVTMLALCLAGLGFAGPDIALKRQAQQRRIEFRHALSAYLDLVTIIIAGGGGITTALQTAADAGAGWAFEEFRHSLDYARLSNRAPWTDFADLAATFDIAELADLASAAHLAGDEGSKLADSVATKAAVLRSRLAAETEATAESLTERMVVPAFGLLLAMFLFIGFGVATELLSPTNTINSPQSIDNLTTTNPNGS